MRLGLIPSLLVLVLLSVPTGLAQTPDPSSVVETACATVGGVSADARAALPVCPREEPAGPAEPAAEPEGDDVPVPDDSPAAGASEVAQEAAETAEESADAPEEAPARLIGFVATVRQFVQDLIGAPVRLGGQGMDALREAGAAVSDGVHEAAATSTAAVSAAVGAVGDAASATVEAGKAAVDAVASAASDAGRAVAGAWERLGGWFSSDEPERRVGTGVDLPDARPTLGALEGVASGLGL